MLAGTPVTLRTRFRTVPGAALFICAGFLCAGCSVQLSPPSFYVVKATDLGVIATNPDILGRDGGYSALFQGYSVWVYGDTFLAQPNAQNFGLISDSWSYTANLSVANGSIGGFEERLDSSGAPAMILPETAASSFNAQHNPNSCVETPCGARYALWPASVVVDPVSGNAFIFYSLIYALPGAFNFSSLGASAATWTSFASEPSRPAINPPVVPAHPDLLFAQNEVSYGAASLIVNGMLYVYGCQSPTNSSDKGCRLGRVNPAALLNRNAWSWYAGNGQWSSRIGDAISVFGGNSILSVAWNSYLHQYIAVYSALFSQNVMIRAAPAPEGPWSAETPAFVAQNPADGSNVYDAHAHAEYDANGGQTIYITYSRATGAFTSEVRVVSVTLTLPPPSTESGTESF